LEFGEGFHGCEGYVLLEGPHLGRMETCLQRIDQEV